MRNNCDDVYNSKGNCYSLLLLRQDLEHVVAQVKNPKVELADYCLSAVKRLETIQDFLYGEAGERFLTEALQQASEAGHVKTSALAYSVLQDLRKYLTEDIDKR